MAIAPEFRDELARLDVLIHREILRLRARYRLSLDEYRGLYISDEQVDALISEADPGAGAAALTEQAAAMAERIGDDSPLGRVARMLALDRFERDVLLAALAPELDVKYDTLYAYLNDSATRPHLTIDLALRLCDGRRTQLNSGARLLREALVECGDAAGERRSELMRPLALAPALVASLQGLPAFDPRLRDWVTTASLPELPLPARLLDRLDRVSDLTPIVVLESEPSHAPAWAAAALLHRFGFGMLHTRGHAVPAERPPWATLALVARLRADGVFVDAEEWGGNAQPQLSSLLASLSGVSVVLAARPRTAWRTLVGDRAAVRVQLDEPDVAERRSLWTRALDRDVAEPDLRAVSEHFRLGPAQIQAAARSIEAPLDAADARDRLFAAAREQSSAELGRLASLVVQRHAFPDLVLPPLVLRRLREVLGAIRARTRVFGDWGFGDRSGRGLMILFAGSSGTGKTMSATVLAREIGLELYRIDLASIVSKYIGETEKNLQQIFDAARSANVMLFFDEADALLGRRSEVKDAHDRYANIEVAYLLQKMEEHDGVVILASNLSKNMDQAFARRIHYVIEFPRPDAALREQLWRRIFPPQVPLARGIDFAFLARQFDLAGGDIKTIALDAAFLAAGQDRPVAMTDLVDAVSRQMLKQGRPLGASDFKQYHGSLSDGLHGAAG
jgi:ATPase family associated with various cellular activities (AAA)/Winged helix domain, variant